MISVDHVDLLGNNDCNRNPTPNPNHKLEINLNSNSTSSHKHIRRVQNIIGLSPKIDIFCI